MSKEYWSKIKRNLIQAQRNEQWQEWQEDFTWEEFNDLIDSGIDPAEQLAAMREDERNGIDRWGDY